MNFQQEHQSKKKFIPFSVFKQTLGCLTVLIALFFQVQVVAQTQGTQPKKPAKGTPQRQSVNFENELVEGSAQKPELFYLFQKKNFNYKKLIRLRENFLPEMRRSAEDLDKRSGG